MKERNTWCRLYQFMGKNHQIQQLNQMKKMILFSGTQKVLRWQLRWTIHKIPMIHQNKNFAKKLKYVFQGKILRNCTEKAIFQKWSLIIARKYFIQTWAWIILAQKFPALLSAAKVTSHRTQPFAPPITCVIPPIPTLLPYILRKQQLATLVLPE